MNFVPVASRLSFDSPAPARVLLLGAGLALCAALQLGLAFVQPVNWDEFRFLADIYLHRQGELISPLQTFHVHLLGWLVLLPGSPIDQIIVGRLLMLLLEWATVALVYLLCRRFTERDSALLAALAFVSFSFVLKHGASLRYDPIVTFLLMSATVLLMRNRLRGADCVGAGAATAVAGLITIKSAIYLPLLGVIAFYRLRDRSTRRNTALLLAGGALAAAIIFALLFGLHHTALGQVDASQIEVSSKARKVFGDEAVFPRRLEFLRSLVANPLHWLLLVLGVASVLKGARAPDRVTALFPLAFLLPLASMALYRNAFPYFFPFMLAPASVLIAIATERAAIRRLAPILTVAMLAGIVWQASTIDRAVLATQRQTVAAAREIFAAGTPYIDRSSMLAGQPQAGFFMSGWGMSTYEAAGVPRFRQAVAERGARFVIANSPWLEAGLTGTGPNRLMPADAALLRDHFVPHYGAIWVLGRRLRLGPQPARFELLAGGEYTVESRDSVVIDGASHQPNDVVELAAGWHQATAEAPQTITLRWGERLRRPSQPAFAGPLFSDF